MKNSPRLLVLGVALVVVARAEIEFVGILVTPQKTQFALTDTATEKTGWLALGDTFAEHKLVGFDRAADTLTLQKAGSETRIHLKEDAKIKSARLELTGTIKLEDSGELLEIERATLLYDKDNIFPLGPGVTYRITPTRREDGTIQYRIAIARVLAPNRTETVSAPSVITLPGKPFSVRIADTGFAFMPR